MIGATRAARTARFRFSSVTNSPNPLLRSASHGSGAVDFGADAVSTVESDRETSLVGSGRGPTERLTQTIEDREIWIGRTNYSSVDPDIPRFVERWVKTSVPASAFGPLGAFGDVGPIDQVASVESVPGVGIEDLGPRMVGTTSTTELQMVAPTCKAESTASGPRETVGPTDVWIDQNDRLVQARTVLVVTVPMGFTFPVGPGRAVATPDPLVGRSTIVSTIRLHGFGSSVAIAASKAVDAHSGGEFAVAVGSPKGCVP